MVASSTPGDPPPATPPPGPRAAALALVGFLLTLIVAVPLLQALVEFRRDRTVQATEVFRQQPTAANLRAYENQLAESSLLARALRPWFQFVQFAWLKDGGEKAVVGRDGWLFYKPGLDATLARRPAKPPSPQDPVATIVRFRDALAARGIHLLVLPAPNKESVYPDQLTRRVSAPTDVRAPATRALLTRLQAAQVEVLDLFALFADARTHRGPAEPALYLKQDSHWSPAGVGLAAQAVADRLVTLGWLKPGPVNYAEHSATVRRHGDVLRMLQSARLERTLPPETIPCRQVIRADTGDLYQDDPQAEVLVLGDSFLRIYHQDEPGAAGFVAHLARALHQPVRSLINDGGASTLVRQELHRRPALLERTRVVVWEFVERDLSLGAEGWQDVPLPPSPGPASAARTQVESSATRAPTSAAETQATAGAAVNQGASRTTAAPADPRPPTGPVPSPEARRDLKVRVSFGHRAPQVRTFTPRLLAGSAHLQVIADSRPLTVGVGIVDAVTAHATWTPSTATARKPHAIWAHFLEHSDPGQIARLLDDPGLSPDAPVLTVLTSPDGTRGFSVGLEQLRRHKALWLPEHDAFVTLADNPVDFAQHVAALRGERTLDRVAREPEATLAQWTQRWEDVGNPLQWNRPWETSWLGTRGHLVGTVAKHGSLYKFGIDRWANVRPDHASPHRFRLDVSWPEAAWRGQHITNGLPLVVTHLARPEQQCVIEQFVAPLHDTPPPRRGEIASVGFSRIQLTGDGRVRLRFRLATETTNRHLVWHGSGAHHWVTDRETGAIWLTLQTDPAFAVQPHAAPEDPKDPRLEFEGVGQLAAGHPQTMVLKLASPPVPSSGSGTLADLDFSTARAACTQYWENWLAQGAHFEVPEQPVNDLFRANLWHALMLPRHRTDDHGVARIDLPYSNFAYGQLNADWPINQAVYVDSMLYGLRGHFAVAEEEFLSMFHTQQKPDGRVGGYAEWGVYSPGMLYALGQNFLLSDDHASFERLLPAALKTLDWCLGEMERGRTSPDAPGLIVAPLNDLTHDARAWGFPNAYFVAGLDVFGRALERFDHPRAPEVRSTATRMRDDVERAFARASVKAPVVQLADRTWINYVPCDALSPRRLLDQWYPTDVDCGPLHLARLAAIDPHGALTTAMLHDHEDNLFLNQGGAANEPVYNPQATVYLRRDEPEAAIRAFYSMMACAFSHHQLSPLEHRWAWGQYFGPPSTDGAWFELYRNLLLNELGEGLTVGQAVPRAWLADGHRITVERAPTHFGPVSLTLDSAAATGHITARLEFSSPRRPPSLRVRLRHPEQRPLRAVTLNGAEWRDFDPTREWIRVPTPALSQYTIVGFY